MSNENSTLVEVYFDDVTVSYTKSNLIQYNARPPKLQRRREYYPFGLQTAGSWTRENTLDNNFLANGGTELNKTSNLYDLEYRNYDQVLGRMNGVDPMTTKYASLTPYNYSFNDPVTFTDVSGADPWDSGPYAGSELYYYSTQGPDGRGPGQAPLQVQDPFYSHETGWTTVTWTWNPYTAGGYNMMAGSYEVPMAGRGLPPSDNKGDNKGVIIEVDWNLLPENSSTFWFFDNGKYLGGIQLVYSQPIVYTACASPNCTCGISETLAGVWTIALIEPTPFGEAIAIAATGATIIVFGSQVLDDARKLWLSKQDKKLSDGEINDFKKRLKEDGRTIHDLKGGKNTGPVDLWKDGNGDIVIKPKDGSGPGEPTGYNVRDLKNN